MIATRKADNVLYMFPKKQCINVDKFTGQFQVFEYLLKKRFVVLQVEQCTFPDVRYSQDYVRC